ncbi:tRNA uridine 5-carboxymethylaminomethyl modification protein [Caminibacter profundus]
MNEENKNEKPFNFWLFIGTMFIGLLILTSIVIGVPYLLMK